MTDLLRKPTATAGRVHHITPAAARGPQSPDWAYVGFSLYHLAPGQTASERSDTNETILVLVEGKAHIACDERDFGEMGARLDVFDKTPPHAAYVPAQQTWLARATTRCVLAVCQAPSKGAHSAQRLGPDGITLTPRGKGQNRRYINNIAMEDRPVADSLLVTEVFTPSGHWSSYPSHRHDQDDFPRITYLEETYYHRLNPAQGFGLQRVYTEDGALDETMAVRDGDVVLVPGGHHPCAAAYGYDLYYLNVMAGPLRKWRFKNDPDHDWIARRDGG